MIKITNGVTNKEVTKGAYKNFYEHLGYQIVGNEEKPKREVEVKPEIKKEEVKEVVAKDNEDKGEKKSQKFEEFKKR